MIPRLIKRTVDLSVAQKVDSLSGPLYQLENEGHTFEITVLRFREPASISGAVTARFIRADGTTVFFAGTLNGNVVSITLPQSCYIINGRFGLTVFIAGSGVTSAVYALAGTVYRSTTDDVIDPEGDFPSVEDVMGIINDCETATAAANTAAADAAQLFGETKNLFQAKDVFTLAEQVTFSALDATSINLAATSAKTWARVLWDVQIEPDTEYTIGVRCHLYSGGSGLMIYGSDNGGRTYNDNPFFSGIDAAGARDRYYKATFTSETAYIRVAFYCTRGTSETGNADYKDIQFVKGNQLIPLVPHITANDFAARTEIVDIANTKRLADGVIHNVVLSLGQLSTETGAESYSGLKCKTEFIPVTALSQMKLFIENKTEITLSVLEFDDNTSPGSNTLLGVNTYTIEDGFLQFSLTDSDTQYIRLMFDAKYENIVGKFILMTEGSYVSRIENEIAKIDSVVTRLHDIKWYRGTLETSASSPNYGTVINDRGLYTNKIYVNEGDLVSIKNLNSLRGITGITYLVMLGYDSSDACIFQIWPYGSYRERTFATTIIRKNIVYVRIGLITDLSTDLTDMGYVPDLTIEKSDGIGELQPAKTWDGVSEMNIEYYQDVSCTYSGGLIHNATYLTSKLYRLPENGVYIYTDPDRVGHLILFYSLSNGELVPAATYPYSFYGTPQENGYNFSAGYYPYMNGVYFRIVIVGSQADKVDSLHVIAGTVTGNGGRLPNLSPGMILGKRAGGSNDKADHSLRILPKKVWYWEGDKRWVNELESINAMYMSVVRVRDANGITAQPPYSLIGRIYRLDHDNRIARIHSEVFGRVAWANDEDKLSRWITGVPHIDLSGLDFDGYIVFAVLGPMSVIASGSGKMMKQDGMGILNRYEDVMNSVYVEWKSGVNITIDGSIPTIAKSNINTIIRNTYAPDMKASLSDGGYGNWNSPISAKASIPAIGKTNGWFYSGSNIYNTPHMHITPKSYITASKNRHSRVYVSTHPQSNRCDNAYGSVCSSTSSLVAGLPGGNETVALMSGLVDGFQVRDYEGVENLQPGDFLCAAHDFAHAEGTEGGGYGHVVYVTEVVKINGEVYCVNAFQGTTPFIGFRTYINFDAFKNYTSETKQDEVPDSDLFEMHSSRYFDAPDYKAVARLASDKYRTIRDAYGAYDTQDYNVSAIMCDRGTDAVYGSPYELMTLTVTDGTTEIDLVVNSTTRHIDLTDYNSVTYSDGIVYDVTGMVQTSGYHEIKVNGTTVESFFVPPLRSPSHVIDGDEVTITFEPPDGDDIPICVQAAYFADGNIDTMARQVLYNFIDVDTVYQDGKCHCTVDRQKTFVDGVTRTFASAVVLRRTPYGTYYRNTTGTRQQFAGTMYAITPN